MVSVNTYGNGEGGRSGLPVKKNTFFFKLTTLIFMVGFVEEGFQKKILSYGRLNLSMCACSSTDTKKVTKSTIFVEHPFYNSFLCFFRGGA